MSSKNILLIEAFYGGSHKQLIDLIYELFHENAELYTLPAKKWHWRALTSALYFSQTIPKVHGFRVLFTSSVLPLAELTALRPDLANLHKIVYFHENQMVYPIRVKKSRYFQYGYNEVLTSLVSNRILFNSSFNKESFLSSLPTFFNIMPDYKPKNVSFDILPKCHVIPFPLYLPETYSKHNPADQKLVPEQSEILNIDQSIDFKSIKKDQNSKDVGEKIHILWPHRWEHDKDPDTFFSVMFRLKNSGVDFYLSVVGETFSEKPNIFEEAEKYLKEHIINWGYKKSKEEYYKVLHSADVVVSTAIHEFFGVSMLEATACNCYPLCPKRLVYPEIYPDEYLYNTPNQLYKKLKYICEHPYIVRNHNIKVDTSKFSWAALMSDYKKFFDEGIREMNNFS